MKTITIESKIEKDVSAVWEYWTNPDHITNWNYASSEWHCPKAAHELKKGGRLNYHMAAKDGSMAFDYSGRFDQILPLQLLEYTLDDGRKVSISFLQKKNSTLIRETFEAEEEYSVEMQRQGWQAILDNFKNYAESK